MNLSLTPELEQFIQSKIESGMYSNASEVVRDALRHMDERDRWKDLREFMAPRIAAAKSGDYTTKSIDEIINAVKGQ